MSIAQLAALIKGWLIWAVGQVVGQIKDFLGVTVGEIEWIAVALGYPSVPFDFGAITSALTVMQGNIDTIETQILALQSAVTALGSPQQAGEPVTLPAVPPSGYASPSSGENASAVWSYVLPLSFNTAGLVQDQLSFVEDMIDNNLVPLRIPDTFFQYVTRTVPLYAPSPQPVSLWNDDPQTIADAATVADWIRNQNPDLVLVDGGSMPCRYPNPYDSTDKWEYVVYLDEATFLGLKRNLSAPRNGAPVWPGLALVTLGTPVALSVGLTVAEPMDGVIVELTSVPTPRGYYSYDGLKGYQQIGALTFIDDNGDAEYIQSLGFTEAVYCPKLMARAAAVKVRTAPGVEGTITPWVIAA